MNQGDTTTWSMRVKSVDGEVFDKNDISIRIQKIKPEFIFHYRVPFVETDRIETSNMTERQVIDTLKDFIAKWEKMLDEK